MLAHRNSVPVLNSACFTMPLIYDLELILFIYNGSIISNCLVSKHFTKGKAWYPPGHVPMNSVLTVLTRIEFAQGAFSSKSVDSEILLRALCRHLVSHRLGVHFPTP